MKRRNYDIYPASFYCVRRSKLKTAEAWPSSWLRSESANNFLSYAFVTPRTSRRRWFQSLTLISEYKGG